MSNVIQILKMISVLVAAIFVGNWYLAELNKIRKKGEPIYKTYFTIPGIIIIVAVLLPVIIWIIRRI